jgi:hypothetical protein
LITWIISGEACKLWSSLLCSLLQLPATFSLSGPNIHLSTLLSNTCNLWCTHSVRVEVSHPYKATGKFKFLEKRWEEKRLWKEC